MCSLGYGKTTNILAQSSVRYILPSLKSVQTGTGGILKRELHTENANFFVHATPEKFENATTTCHFGFVFKKTRSGKSRDYHELIFVIIDKCGQHA